ncbi:MAG: 4'-phosphopantetheinyl transferase [Terriglobales bacterium]|jgi:4'-phosphopantetheinyl transferase EntD
MATAIPECAPTVSFALTGLECKDALERLITGALQEARRSLGVNADIAVAITCAEDGSNYELHPEEARALSPRVRLLRRLQWSLGRAAAHTALRKVGVTEPGPIIPGNMREPIWPAGMTGSVTHCYPWSVAVAGRSSGRFSIGIDLESVDRIGQTDISSVVCRRAERDWVGAPGDSRMRLCMIFSAKEALYKSLYPVCRRYIDFQEAELSWHAERSCFYAGLIGTVKHVPGRLSTIPLKRYHNLIFSCSICEKH